MVTFQAKDAVGSKPKPKNGRVQKTKGPGSSDKIRDVFKHMNNLRTGQISDNWGKVTERWHIEQQTMGICDKQKEERKGPEISIKEKEFYSL